MSSKTVILYQVLLKLHVKVKAVIFKNNLLYHRAKLLEQTVERLVVPCDRRKNILNLAHNLVGRHMGIRRTKDRIALSFMWPNLTNDVIDYCRTCEICQRRAKITCSDKVPIHGGVVSVESVFSHFFVYCDPSFVFLLYPVKLSPIV